MTLMNEVALVTGASRGIGQAIALELARQGAHVIGTATSAAGAEAISAGLAAQQLRGGGHALDVTQDGAIESFIKALDAAGHTPTILVNNAGITRDNLILRMKDEDWDAVIETNLSSVFRLSKTCLRPMLKARRGRIINIASVVGAMGNAGQANYAAAKAGMMGLTKALAREVGARGITINCVAPGFIDTDMTRALPEAQREALFAQIPLARFGTVEEVAALVAFLAGPTAGYITGQTLHVNGGMLMP
jgi:3-oxoacyl-[acyl-carrier protein] reductase